MPAPKKNDNERSLHLTCDLLIWQLSLVGMWGALRVIESGVVYILFVCAGDSFGNLWPVLALLHPDVFFVGNMSFPLTALHEEWINDFSRIARSNSSPVSGVDQVLVWPILRGSWNKLPVGNESVLLCFFSLDGWSILSVVSVLFGGWFSAEENTMRSDT